MVKRKREAQGEGKAKGRRHGRRKIGHINNPVSVSMSSWADLPIDLFRLILSRLGWPDHLRLGCVCASWRSAVRLFNERPKPQPPWLMLPPDADDDDATAKFYSFSERRSFNIHLPLPAIGSRVCLGSSFGWLITATDDMDMHLLNPLTGVQVELPSADHIHGVYVIGKAVLSAAPLPDGGGDYFVILIPMYNFTDVEYARAGDTYWSTACFKYVLKFWDIHGKRTNPLAINDIIHYKEKLYAVLSLGKPGHAAVFSWDSVSHRKSCTPTFFVGRDFFGCGHLVESVSGELLVLLRKKEGYLRRTTWFKIWRLDEVNNEWLSVDDLGDNVIFVGANHSMSVSASECPGFRRNCIYFTDGEFPDKRRHRTYRRDAGMYDVKDKELTHIKSIGPWHANWPPPVWFSPSVLLSTSG